MIKENKLTSEPFYWQAGYGVFLYSPDAISNICNYIMNQKEHHKSTSFKKEYAKLLEEFDVEVGRKESFDFFDE